MLDAGLPIAIREQFGVAEALKVPRFLQAALLGGGALDGGDRVTPLRDWPLRSHGAQVRDIFTAERHQQLASFQDLYIGLPPEEAPAVFGLLQAIELAPQDPQEEGENECGVFYPMGGWGEVRDLFVEAVESAGVRCLWGTTVTAVTFDEAEGGEGEEGGGKGKVSGVRIARSTAGGGGGGGGEGHEKEDPCPGLFAASGAAAKEEGDVVEEEFLPADCVVINGDLATTEPLLLPPERRRSEYKDSSEEGGSGGVSGRLSGGYRYSSSTVSFFFCLERRYPELRHHNVFIGDKEAWDGLFDGAAYKDWHARSGTINFYVHAPARTDPSAVEADGDDAIMVLVPVPPIDERLSDEARDAATRQTVTRAREQVLAAFERAGMVGFEDAIVEERVRTPLQWREAYGLRRGAVFGLSHGLDQLSLFRPGRGGGGGGGGNGKADGVHWVGASTRPGNGVPLVLIGAMKVAEEVVARLRTA